MDIRTYLDNVLTEYRTNGVRSGAQVAGRNFLFGVYHNLPLSIGTPVFEREWDVLIILDACRPDLIEEVSEAYDFLPSKIPTTYSVASNSSGWMKRNFVAEYRDEMSRTAYVTGNPFSYSFCSERDFGFLDEVWHYAWDEDIGSVAADDITDRAIATGRNHDFDRLIVHYMQPHFPSFPDPIAEGMDLEQFGSEDNSAWDLVQDETLSRQEVWRSYRANLEYVLNSVGTLLRNVGGQRVILSSDHGNVLGEWGLYGHPPNKPVPALRRVPWVHVSATDTNEYVPDLGKKNVSVRTTVSDRLRSLGYKT